ncbi:hypothetical protein VSWAT3_19681 [Vibrionales bacterium SWAT-3]|nr:hypothetical protein VSWAT3_19681 [Vibrionales bacterium SWAT-3]
MSPKIESFNKDIIVISAIWLVCATVIFLYKWESVSTLSLNDNDDYMRFVQFQDWMTTGHWYLEPMSNFNAADGIVIHWSRFPDLMLSFVAFPLSFIVEEHLAYIISISVVPLLYLLLFSLSCFLLCDHFFGAKYRFFSMMFAISSPSIIHFLPGSIDHHNIQLIFAVLFLASTPLNHNQLSQSWRVYAQALLLSLSLWTGLENVLLFMIFFVIYTVYSGLVCHEWLAYTSKLYASSTLFGSCAVLLNRPYDEFFVSKFDEISFVLILLFFCGWLFVNVYHRLMSEDKSLLQKFLLFVFLAVLFLFPVAMVYPSLSSALFIDYPPLLKLYWLDQVTEAKSIVRYVTSQGFFSIENYALLVIPATLYLLFKNKNDHCTILYLIFIFNLALALFWQIRVMRLCFVLAAPLQAYVIIQLADCIRSSIIKAVVIFSGAPLAVAFVILALSPTEEITTTLDRKEQSLSLHKVLKDNDINSHTILSGIETGAPVLAKTDNRIIAAPYHRNIFGNQFLIEVMLEENLHLAEKKIIDKHIDIIVVGNDPHLLMLKKSASQEALINKLYSSDTPAWLEVVYDNIESGYRVFRVRGS